MTPGEIYYDAFLPGSGGGFDIPVVVADNGKPATANAAGVAQWALLSSPTADGSYTLQVFHATQGVVQTGTVFFDTITEPPPDGNGGGGGIDPGLLIVGGALAIAAIIFLKK